jgi:hypothetical protein
LPPEVDSPFSPDEYSALEAGRQEAKALEELINQALNIISLKLDYAHVIPDPRSGLVITCFGYLDRSALTPAELHSQLDETKRRISGLEQRLSFVRALCGDNPLPSDEAVMRKLSEIFSVFWNPPLSFGAKTL